METDSHLEAPDAHIDLSFLDMPEDDMSMYRLEDLDLSPCTSSVAPTIESFGNRTHASSSGAIRKRPIPRKGHTKSRRGCFNCKKRKIKCCELRPACAHCTKAGLSCEYPKLRVQDSRIEQQRADTHDDASINEDSSSAERSSSSSTELALLEPKPMVCFNSSLHGTPTSFSMLDMRLWHHFLKYSYPHLPVGFDSIWITTIPHIAFEYPYLMQALLALAASHMSALLTSTTPQNTTSLSLSRDSDASTLSAQALTHRTSALTTLNASILTPAASRAEADARMGTALALSFQSVHLPNHYAEYLTLLRGCWVFGADHMIMSSAVDAAEPSAFAGFVEQGHLANMKARLGTVETSPCNPARLSEALVSLHRLKTLCKLDYEIEIVDTMIETVTFAEHFPSKAYASFSHLYSLPPTLPLPLFSHLILPPPLNPTGALLLAHFLGIQQVLIPILAFEHLGKETSRVHSPTVMNTWVGDIVRGLGGEEGGWREFWRWPVEVVDLDFKELFSQQGMSAFAREMKMGGGK